MNLLSIIFAKAKIQIKFFVMLMKSLFQINFRLLITLRARKSKESSQALAKVNKVCFISFVISSAVGARLIIKCIHTFLLRISCIGASVDVASGTAESEKMVNIFNHKKKK